jgi:hypothetical protein
MSNIKVGDLVMVVKPQPCCGRTEFIGTTFEVTEIRNGMGECFYCKQRYRSIGASRLNSGGFFDVHRLIKIDPPALPESLEREKELSV